MTTNYDTIATEYQQSKLQPWRTYIESPSLMGLVGDLSEQRVVDLACGEGYYTRQYADRGAQRVLGVDLSPRMIELARQQEAASPCGAAYRVADVTLLDVTSPELSETFDLAAAAYLLNYAPDRQELSAMCRSVAWLLRRRPLCHAQLQPGAVWLHSSRLPGIRLRDSLFGAGE